MSTKSILMSIGISGISDAEKLADALEQAKEDAIKREKGLPSNHCTFDDNCNDTSYEIFSPDMESIKINVWQSADNTVYKLIGTTFSIKAYLEAAAQPNMYYKFCKKNDVLSDVTTYYKNE